MTCSKVETAVPALAAASTTLHTLLPSNVQHRIVNSKSRLTSYFLKHQQLTQCCHG